MLISLARTAFQALTFNVNPSLLPRWEVGPLVVAFGAAVLSGTAQGAPVDALLVIVLGLLLLALQALQSSGISRAVPGEMVALGYLLSVGVLIFNVPAVLVAALGLAYSGGPGILLEAANSAGSSGFRSVAEMSPVMRGLLQEIGAAPQDTHAFVHDLANTIKPVALLFIFLSLASARPKIRRAFFRDDVRMAQTVLMHMLSDQSLMANARTKEDSRTQAGP